MSNGTDLDALRDALIDRLESLAASLLGAPSIRKSRTWRWGSKGSLAVEMTGRKRGQWFSHEAGEGGGPFQLIQHARRCRFAEAVDWARDFCGMAGDEGQQRDDADRRQREQERARKQAEAGAEQAADEAKRTAHAKRLWNESTPIGGTVAEQYLVETRCIPRPAGGWPDAVRFHAPSRALIVAATHDDDAVQAVQRVRLTADGRKAEGSAERPTKQTSGALTSGAVVRLPPVKPPHDAAVSTEPVLIAEGPETGLSVWVASGHETLIALGSFGQIAPPAGRVVVVCRDDDRAWSQADKTLHTLADEWREAGVDVRVASPWATRRGDKSDFNDVLQSDGVDAVRARIAAALQPQEQAPRRLPAFYDAPAEPRETALARQNATISSTISGGAHRASLVKAIRVARKDAIDACAEWKELSPADKGKITRRAVKAVLASAGIKRLPSAQRVLTTGAQGTGKTTTAIKDVAAIRGDVAVRAVMPALAKAEEFAAAYREVMQPDSLPVMVVRGRNAKSPADPRERMCGRHKAVKAAAEKGVNVRKTICASCPLRPIQLIQKGCGYLRQEQRIDAMGERGLFVGSNSYLHLPMPGPSADILIVDESVTLGAVDPLDLSPAALRDRVPFRGGGLADAIAANATTNRVLDALQAPRPVAALAEAGVTRDRIRTAMKVARAAYEEPAVEITGAMPDQEIIEAVEAIPDDVLGHVLVVLAAVLRELDLGRDTLTGIVFHPDREVKIDGRKERMPRLRVHRLRRLMGITAQTTVLLMDGTGNPYLNRALFGDLEHVHTPVERDAHVTGTTGKTYSRQSITGCNRHGVEIPTKKAEAERLRQDIATIASRMAGPVLVASTKPAAEALNDVLPRNVAEPVFPSTTRAAHYGAVRGMNAWEHCPSALIVGPQSVSVEAVEDIARAFMASDPAPFVSFAASPPADWQWQTWPYRATRGRRMRDGTVQPVEVEVHPDPRCQAVLEQVREAEILQTADRVRPVFNRRTIVLMNELVLDLTYDRVLTHADLVAGGTRWERAWEASGILPLGAADLYRLHRQIFASEAEAKEALKWQARKWGVPQIRYYLDNAPLFIYRREGQRGSASRVLMNTVRHPDPRSALESALGPLAAFEPRQPATAATPQPEPTEAATPPPAPAAPCSAPPSPDAEPAEVPAADDAIAAVRAGDAEPTAAPEQPPETTTMSPAAVARLSDAENLALRARLQGGAVAPDADLPAVEGGYGEMLPPTAFLRPASADAVMPPDLSIRLPGGLRVVARGIDRWAGLHIQAPPTRPARLFTLGDAPPWPPDLQDGPQSVPTPAPPRLVPDVPTPAQRTRLAALSGRMEAVRPPSLWGDEFDEMRIEAWRARVARARPATPPPAEECAG